MPGLLCVPVVRKTRHEPDQNTVVRGDFIGKMVMKGTGAAQEQCFCPMYLTRNPRTMHVELVSGTVQVLPVLLMCLVNGHDSIDSHAVFFIIYPEEHGVFP